VVFAFDVCVLLNPYHHYQKTGTAFQFDRSIALASDNIMDKWILSACQSLIEYIHEQMKGISLSLSLSLCKERYFDVDMVGVGYYLYRVGPKLVRFIDQLTNWYVRFNRKRMKGALGEEQRLASLHTLFEVLFTLTLAMV
jgi:isoleucyl-tRNA synthetase